LPANGSSSGGLSSQSPKPNRQVTRNNIQKPARNELMNEPALSQLSERELIAMLTTRIESLRDSQHQAEIKYSDSIHQLKSELTRCNLEYDQQCQEFDRIKSEIIGTKKDIASLIGLVQKNKNNGVSEEGAS